MEDFIGLVIVGAVVLAILIVPALWIDSATCNSKARAMGVEKSWGPLQGCVIKARNGQWVPLDNYREFGDEPKK